METVAARDKVVASPAEAVRDIDDGASVGKTLGPRGGPPAVTRVEQRS